MRSIVFLMFLIPALGFSQIKAVDVINAKKKTDIERDAITVVQGLIDGSIVLKDDYTLEVYNGSAWVSLGGSGGSGNPDWTNITNIPADIADGDDDTQLDIDTFAELDAIVADKSLVNLEDDQTFTGLAVFERPDSNLPTTGTNRVSILADGGSKGEYPLEFDFYLGPNGITTPMYFRIEQNNNDEWLFNAKDHNTGLSWTHMIFHTTFPTESGPAVEITGRLRIEDAVANDEAVSLGQMNTAIAGASGTGEVNTASNLGTGEGLATTKSGVDLPFKSLVAGTNITLSSDANEVTINATGGGTDDQTAAEVPNTPSGNLVATDVQGALNELQTEIDGIGGGGIQNVVEDTTPQLGGNLDVNSNDVTGTGNIDITGNIDATGVSINPTYSDFAGRIATGGNPGFGGSRLGDSDLQTETFDVNVITFKENPGGTQQTEFTQFWNNNVFTNRHNSAIGVADFNSDASSATYGVDDAEATVATSIDYTGGQRYFRDFGVQRYEPFGSLVSQSFFNVYGNTGGAARQDIIHSFYDGTTYDEIFRHTTTGLTQFSYDVEVPNDAYDEAAWNGSLETPTKDAVRDQIESIGAGQTRLEYTYISSGQTITLDNTEPLNAAGRVSYFLLADVTFEIVPPDDTYTIYYEGIGTDNSLRATTTGQAITFERQGDKTYVVTYTPETFETTFAGPAIYDGQNAADPNNEVDGTANTANGGGDFTITSIGTDSQDGSFSLRFVRSLASGSAATGFLELPNAVSGTNYTVSVWYKTIVGNQFSIELQDTEGWTTDENIDADNSTWTQLTFAPQNATSTPPRIRVRSFGAGAVNDEILIDNIVVTQN